MSETTKHIVPEKVTIGGIEYSTSETPELKSLISTVSAKVATEEKAKLYSTIEELKMGVKALESVTPKINVDTNALKNEIAQIVKDQLGTALGPLTEQGNMLRETSVNDYRNKLLMENQGKCIPELVVGKTKEELDAALVASLELGKKYTPQGTTTTTTAINTPQPVVTATSPVITTADNTAAPIVAPHVPTPPTPPIVPGTPVSQPAPAIDFANMTPEEFARNRGELEKKLRSLV